MRAEKCKEAIGRLYAYVGSICRRQYNSYAKLIVSHNVFQLLTFGAVPATV